ncbi:MAG: alanine--tRNA ligase, partial [Armatimonadetes bacterium]|nr:alanine--tRNA ligase [Armatimonadota bacterium]
AEAGGQVGDTGTITWRGGRFEVLDTQFIGEARGHVGRLVRGRMYVGQQVTAAVNIARRWEVRRHHTSTHLLQAALRKVLGQHVSQAGSLVEPTRTRFDFTHHAALSDQEIARVEELVNRWILSDRAVRVTWLPLQEALERGATALFGEKYGETVRMVEVSGVSAELCGGTHVTRTGQIGAFRIVGQEAVAAGVRRIEAVAGLAALRRERQREALLREISQRLNAAPEELIGRIEALQEQVKQLQEEVRRAKQMRAATSVEDLIASALQVGPAKLVAQFVRGADRDILASLVDEIVARLPSAVAVLGSEVDGKAAVVCKVSRDLVDRGVHAGEIVREIAEMCGGGGGGRPQFAQAGGRDASKLPEAIAAATQIVARQLGLAQ